MSAEVDTGALSNWICSTWLRDNLPETEVETDVLGARAVDGRPVSVLGSCRIQVELWGKVYSAVPFRVMKVLPACVLLGRWWLSSTVGLQLDLRRGVAEFQADGERFSGTLRRRRRVPPTVDMVEEELVAAAIEDDEVDRAVMSLDLSSFSTDILTQKRLWQVI